jgi:hypothetical protein
VFLVSFSNVALRRCVGVKVRLWEFLLFSCLCGVPGSVGTKFQRQHFFFPLCLCGEKQAKEMRGMGLIYPSKLDALYLCCTGVERST